MTLKDILSDGIPKFKEYGNLTLSQIATDREGDGSIFYKMNEDGYRSRSLKEKSDFNILCLGCSWTMGVGVNDKDSWPTIISNMMQEKIGKECAVFNYSMYGISPSFISKILYKITQSEFIPDLLLIMWPGFSRRDYLNDLGEFKKIGGFRYAHENDVVWKNNPEDLLFIELRNDNQDSMIFWETYKLSEMISKFYNIKTYHTVAGYYYEIFKKLNLYDTIDSSTFFMPENCYKNDFMARDKEHPGPGWHRKFAENFFKFITNENSIQTMG